MPADDILSEAEWDDTFQAYSLSVAQGDYRAAEGDRQRLRASHETLRAELAVSRENCKINFDEWERAEAENWRLRDALYGA